MSLPKVLIINQPFVSNTGGGITLSNLFSNWPKEKLAVACSGYILNSNIDPAVCDNYYQLGSLERKWIFPFNLFSRKYPSGRLSLENTSKNEIVENDSKSKVRVGFLTKYVQPFMEYLGLIHFMSKTTISKNFIEWVEEYNPDIIYGQSSNREGVLFCFEVQQFFKKPFVFHMMDDWPKLVGVNGLFGSYWERKINGEIQAIWTGCTEQLVISDYMASEYSRRYGKKYLTFHNPVNTAFWRKGEHLDYRISQSPNILYAGRIGLSIDDSLETIALALDKVNAELGFKGTFTIQSPKVPDWLNKYNCVRHQELVDYDRLPYVFGEADLLVLPYDFTEKSIEYIKYSMPTKASEYMASGTPILIFAPKETALVEYAERGKWAEVVIENNVEVLATKITDLFRNENLRKSIGEIAKKRAVDYHDDKVVVKNFRNTLIGMLNKNFK